MTTTRILIVDDEPIGRLALKTLLAQEGYDLDLACNGQEAIQLAQDKTPDLVLLDVVLPDISGFDVCKHLRSHPETAHTPIIMITSLDDRAALKQGIEAGANEITTKPVDFIALRDKVRNLTQI